MFTRRRRPPLFVVNTFEAYGHAKDLHNREDLEEVVFSEIFMRVVFMQLD